MTRLGSYERIDVKGLDWPLRVRHVSMSDLAEFGASEGAEFGWPKQLRLRAMHGGPSSPAAFAEWLSLRPALVATVIDKAIEVQRPTTQEHVMLRILGALTSDDGVCGLEAGDPPAAELGFVADCPMTRPYAHYWDAKGPVLEYKDRYVEATERKGLGAYVHPSLFTTIAPRLRQVMAYHNYARLQTYSLTRKEYLSMSALEVAAHRTLRDAINRRSYSNVDA